MALPESSEGEGRSERVPAWLKWAGVAAVFAAANFGYGIFCDSKCGDLCREQGFARASWSNSSGFWTRLISASSGNHGTCLCTSGEPVSALRPMTVKELRLTFGKQ